MNSEPGVEPFIGFLPIPQRVVLLLVFGLWLWVCFLRVAGSHYDVSKVVVSHEPTGLPHYPSSVKLYQSSLKLFKSIVRVIVPWQIVCMLLLRYSMANDISNSQIWLFLNVSPLLELVFIVVTVLRFSPMVTRCLKRIVWFANIEPKPFRNNYIIISDTLLSYSKPFVDMAIYTTFFVHDPTNVKCQLERYGNAVSMNIDVLVAALPAVIRMVQSLREYSRSRTGNKRDRSQLFNAFKYAGNIPVMLVTVYTRYYKVGPIPAVNWIMLWNSMYSFWWDLTMDWKLGLFNFKNAGTEVENTMLNGNDLNHDILLRHTLLYGNAAWYYAGILADFLLRFVWFWEYVSGHSVFYGELNIFWLQSLEIFRRWIWLFFKIEAEYITVVTDSGKMDE